jgi:hypothetical protein
MLKPSAAALLNHVRAGEISENPTHQGFSDRRIVLGRREPWRLTLQRVRAHLAAGLSKSQKARLRDGASKSRAVWDASSLACMSVSPGRQPGRQSRHAPCRRCRPRWAQQWFGARRPGAGSVAGTQLGAASRPAVGHSPPPHAGGGRRFDGKLSLSPCAWGWDWEKNSRNQSETKQPDLTSRGGREVRGPGAPPATLDGVGGAAMTNGRLRFGPPAGPDRIKARCARRLSGRRYLDPGQANPRSLGRIASKLQSFRSSSAEKTRENVQGT